MATITLGGLAALVKGRVLGDAELLICGAATLEQAQPGDISFLDHPRLIPQVSASQAAAVVVPEGCEDLGRPLICVPHVREAFGRIVRHFRPPFESPRVGISPLASVHPTAELAADVEVHPFAVIGPDVRIGRGATIHAHACILARCQIEQDVTIYPGAVLYENTVVGARTVIHAGAVLGAYGFGYDTVEGRHCRGDQLGFVQIGCDVEIGAGATIDRGTYGPTVIGEGTKIDNQVMVAHNCQIGCHNLICSQVGIAGSSSSGDYVVMAGQVGVPDHVRIGHRAVLGAKAGIMRDVADDATVIGIPATPEREQMARQAALARLPEMRRQLRNLQRQVEQLSQQLGHSSTSQPPTEAA